MVQLQSGNGALLATRPTPAQRPVIRVVVDGGEVLQTGSIMETIIDAFFDRMRQASVVVCVRCPSSEQTHARSI